MNEPARGRRPMGRPANADSAATRRAILAAASAELASAGYEGLNLETVATQVGITRGAIYRYFGSKRELARVAVQQSLANLEDSVERLVYPAEGLAEQLRTLIRVAANVVFDDPGPSIGYFELGRLAEHDDQIATLFRSRSMHVRKVVVDLVARAADRGELADDVDEAAIVGAVSGLIWAVGSGAAGAPNDVVRREILLGIDLILQPPPWTVP